LVNQVLTEDHAAARTRRGALAAVSFAAGGGAALTSIGRKLLWVGSALFLLVALLNLAVGAYHTVLFASQGPQSMFATAYRIPVSDADMADPARSLGGSAIAVYSMLLAGNGLLSIWGTVSTLRGNWSGLMLNLAVLGFSQLAVVYGLIIPGHLRGAIAYLGPGLFALAVAGSVVGLSLTGRREAAP
jgi:hypothetical protein